MRANDGHDGCRTRETVTFFVGIVVGVILMIGVASWQDQAKDHTDPSDYPSKIAQP